LPREYSRMSGPDEAKPEPPAADPEALAKALEMELIMKRASWQKTRAQRGSWRALSFLFLLLVVLGALAAYFYFAGEVSHRRPKPPGAEAADSSR
jgi:hypothetical protein